MAAVHEKLSQSNCSICSSILVECFLNKIDVRRDQRDWEAANNLTGSKFMLKIMRRVAELKGSNYLVCSTDLL